MTLFLIGPSDGYFDHNRKAFDAAAKKLRKVGMVVVNPREIEDSYTDPKAIFRAMLDCEAAAMMPGSEDDQQGRLQLTLAGCVGMEIHHLENLLGKR